MIYITPQNVSKSAWLAEFSTRYQWTDWNEVQHLMSHSVATLFYQESGPQLSIALIVDKFDFDLAWSLFDRTHTSWHTAFYQTLLAEDNGIAPHCRAPIAAALKGI